MAEMLPDHPPASASLPTAHGTFQMYTHTSRFLKETGEPHIVLVHGSAQDIPPLVRIHSECLTGDVFGSARCDCGAQLDESMRLITERGWGVVIYLRQEGRGIGIENKLKAYFLQEQGLDTVDANLALGLPGDDRSFTPAVEALHDLQISELDLLTNNPAKLAALRDHGLRVRHHPLHVHASEHAADYLETKRERMGHHAPPPVCDRPMHAYRSPPYLSGTLGIGNVNVISRPSPSTVDLPPFSQR
jgi:3,4-dihydroxy 2-butanone 4-phosphate synthase/GTP cyclohydrolase II